MADACEVCSPPPPQSRVARPFTQRVGEERVQRSWMRIYSGQLSQPHALHYYAAHLQLTMNDAIVHSSRMGMRKSPWPDLFLPCFLGNFFLHF